MRPEEEKVRAEIKDRCDRLIGKVREWERKIGVFSYYQVIGGIKRDACEAADAAGLGQAARRLTQLIPQLESARIIDQKFFE